MVFQSVGVVRYLFWLGKPAIVRDEEIDTIKKWLILLRPMIAYTFQVGMPQLESGLFKKKQLFKK
jgi:hypothetical protein